ncbi:putative branched-chain amino acid permease (azaleucine resistance), partial [Snodgrassella alvi SCGC AB-598-O02]
MVLSAPKLSPRHEMKRGLIAALPIMLSFVPFALLLGAQAVQKGITSGQITLMAGINFAG